MLISSEYELVSLSGHDTETIEELRRQIVDNELHQPPTDPQRAKWLYSLNPAGPAEILGLRQTRGSWVGMVAIVPRQLYLDGHEHVGAFLCDFFVHPKHRSLLPAMALQKEAKKRLEEAGRVNYSIPNPKSIVFFRRLGASSSRPRYRWARPLRSREYFARRNLRMLASLSPALDAFGKTFDHALSLTQPKVRVDWIDHFDHRFDDFWSVLPRRGICIGSRSSSFLKWRFLQEPAHQNLTLTLSDAGDQRLLGYLIGEIVGDIFSIRDVILGPLITDTVGPLCRALLAIRNLGVSGVDVRISGPPDLLRSLRNAGFRPRELEIAYVRNETNEHIDWILSRADEDV